MGKRKVEVLTFSHEGLGFTCYSQVETPFVLVSQLGCASMVWGGHIKQEMIIMTEMRQH